MREKFRAGKPPQELQKSTSNENRDAVASNARTFDAKNLKRLGLAASIMSGVYAGFFSGEETSRTDNASAQDAKIEKAVKALETRDVKKIRSELLAAAAVLKHAAESGVEAERDYAQESQGLVNDFKNLNMTAADLAKEVSTLRDVNFASGTFRGEREVVVTVDSMLRSEEAIDRYDELVNNVKIEKDEDFAYVYLDEGHGFDLTMTTEVEEIDGKEFGYLVVHNSDSSMGEGTGEQRILLTEDKTLEEIISGKVVDAVVNSVRHELQPELFAEPQEY